MTAFIRDNLVGLTTVRVPELTRKFFIPVRLVRSKPISTAKTIFRHKIKN